MVAPLAVTLTAQIGTFHLAVAFTAPPGITALFGPSGAGKTQTLRCIAGLVQPEMGRIVLQERVLFDQAARINLPTRERRIGYLFQQYALFPHLDVAGNVGYGLAQMARSERTRRVAALLELVGLAGYERRPARELSGGQQQRVALARALAPDPALLLLDEPFAAVDALARRQLRAELRTIQERTGIPMLLVTHDWGEVRQLAQYVVVYDQGRILQAGPPEELRTQPSSESVRELLAAAGDTAGEIVATP